MTRMWMLCVLVMALVMTEGCKWQLANEPTLLAYQSFDESKENHAFVVEYIPQNPNLEIEGKKFKISKAWIEKAHLQKNFRDEIADSVLCFVMTLNHNPNEKIALEDYISELGNGNDRVWFFLGYKFKSDTIKLNYRHSIKQRQKSDIFLLRKSVLPTL